MTDADQELLLDILNHAIGWRIKMLRLETSVAPTAPDELERIKTGLLALAKPSATLAPDRNEWKP